MNPVTEPDWVAFIEARGTSECEKQNGHRQTFRGVCSLGGRSCGNVLVPSGRDASIVSHNTKKREMGYVRAPHLIQALIF